MKVLALVLLGIVAASTAVVAGLMVMSRFEADQAAERAADVASLAREEQEATRPAAEAERERAGRDAECVRFHELSKPRSGWLRSGEDHARIMLGTSLLVEHDLKDCLRKKVGRIVDIERAFPGLTESLLTPLPADQTSPKNVEGQLRARIQERRAEIERNFPDLQRL